MWRKIHLIGRHTLIVHECHQFMTVPSYHQNSSKFIPQNDHYHPLYAEMNEPFQTEEEKKLNEKRYGCSVIDPSFIFTQIYRHGDKIHPAVEKWFRSMDTQNAGRITSKELQQAFELFQGRHFSDSTCKFVVRLFDLDRNGGLDIKEFESLYYHIKLWINAFNIYDRDRSGYLDENELDQALREMDIHFTPDFVRFLIRRSNPNAKKMSLDQYIITCIQIQKFTDEFKNRDTSFSGNINVKYEEFLELILRCL
ncbi:unnamed protein product [Phaedon cochleariae]|uniref:EF-hand domain-containing protein n=1 Tax=Phaedon cochleariae TaxID=80249 RepID=A0A9P0DVS6_PHACE|nr:unnamed protein product [Phaedon cochleariae]